MTTQIAHYQNAGCGAIDANLLVREKAERFAVYAATIRFSQNIAEEVMKAHHLPSRMNADELARFLDPARIANYKELWAEDEERILRLEAPSTADLLAKVHQHWRGEPPSRDWEELQFNLILEGSLAGLNLVITKACYDFEIA